MIHLGRDIPFAAWAALTGVRNHFSEPGKVPYDFFEDV